MKPAATPPDMRTALANLATVAAGFAVAGRVRQTARTALRNAVLDANAALAARDRMSQDYGARAGVAPALSVNDPDAVVEAWIAAGGDWCALTAAVNRNALRGSTASRRHGSEKPAIPTEEAQNGPG